MEQRQDRAAQGWRERILEEFPPGAARLTLVADPDGLLFDSGLLAALEERGFDLLPFEDSVAFRFAYESKYRARVDEDERAGLIVVLRAAESALSALPWDLLQAGRRLSFSLADLFPDLSAPVVEALDRDDLDALYAAQIREAPGAPLGEARTRAFVLRRVFGIEPATVADPPALLRLLLERHHRNRRVPAALDRALVQALRARFADWPLERVVPDREAFFGFLQERWPVFLTRRAAGSFNAGGKASGGGHDGPVQPGREAGGDERSPPPHADGHGDGGRGHRYRGGAATVGEPAAAYGLAFPGPADLPFDHDDVRVYVDTLFLEGLLRPVAHPAARRLAGSWAAAGVRTDPAADRRRRLAGLLEKAEASLPGETAGHRDWLAFARVWAELNALRFAGGPTAAGQDERYNAVQERLTDEQDERYSAVRDHVDVAFAAWLGRRFSTLRNQPPAPPVMVHHVARLLARRLSAADRGRVALVVVDGLSLDQWVTVREELAEQRPSLRCRDGALFAWIPTLTMVSRQACFAGRAPFYFPGDIHTTDREPAAWRRFWADEGLGAAAVGYEKNLRGADDLPRVERLVSDVRIRALGLVVDTVDRIMHGMVLGGAGMHGQVRQWTAEGFPAALLDRLLDAGFHVALTADHGNVEARGAGRIAEGALAELRGQRVRVFNDPTLRGRTAARAPGAVEWPPTGLPDDYLALLAPGRTAFVAESERPVAHGGAALEEVIVPFVEIDRR